MSIHIGAKEGQIAHVVLLPGDPLRANRIAQKVLHEVMPYNTVRNMLGFTGVANVPGVGEVRVSVQGSGMGMPSLSIYVDELFNEYGVETIVRVGTCGGLHDDMHSGDLVIAQGACSARTSTVAASAAWTSLRWPTPTCSSPRSSRLASAAGA